MKGNQKVLVSSAKSPLKLLDNKGDFAAGFLVQNPSWGEAVDGDRHLNVLKG